MFVRAARVAGSAAAGAGPLTARWPPVLSSARRGVFLLFLHCTPAVAAGRLACERPPEFPEATPPPSRGHCGGLDISGVGVATWRKLLPILCSYFFFFSFLAFFALFFVCCFLLFPCPPATLHVDVVSPDCLLLFLPPSVAASQPHTPNTPSPPTCTPHGHRRAGVGGGTVHGARPAGRESRARDADPLANLLAFTVLPPPPPPPLGAQGEKRGAHGDPLPFFCPPKRVALKRGGTDGPRESSWHPPAGMQRAPGVSVQHPMPLRATRPQLTPAVDRGRPPPPSAPVIVHQTGVARMYALRSM